MTIIIQFIGKVYNNKNLEVDTESQYFYLTNENMLTEEVGKSNSYFRLKHNGDYSVKKEQKYLIIEQ